MMTVIDHISTQVLAILIDARETRRRLERTMPDATAAAISYEIADPYGTQEWGQTVATAVAAAEIATKDNGDRGQRRRHAAASGPGTKARVPQTAWDLPVSGMDDPGHKDWKVSQPLTEKQLRHYNPTDESDGQPEGLEGLDGFQAVNAERRRNARGPESTQRARVMASVLGVDADALGKYVHGLLRKTPQANRWSHQEDLESAIYTMLYKGREWAGGSMERCQVVASGAYKDWYSLYSNHAQLGVEAINRSISLERHYASDRQDAEAVGHDLGDNAWVGWEEAVVDNADAWWAMAALPAEIQVVVERKANGVPITGNERKRLTRFLAGGPTKRSPSTPTNKDILASIMKGTHLGPVRWNKPKR
jgi:hypothetical protein